MTRITSIRGGEKGDGKSVSMQLMITTRMRNILVNDLKCVLLPLRCDVCTSWRKSHGVLLGRYLPEEVDEMDPSVAALIIEKGLTRPLKGMPRQWRR